MFRSKNIKIIRSSAFYGCVSLQEINVENVTTIESSAFAYCQSIVSHHYRLLKQLTNVYTSNHALVQIIGEQLESYEPIENVKIIDKR